MTGKITGPLREQSDWEQQDENRLGFIKNKPFYDTRKIEELTLRVDLTTFTKEDVIATNVIKISDVVPTADELAQVTTRIYMEGELIVEYEPKGEVTKEGPFYGANGLLLIQEETQFVTSILTPGLYIPMQEEDFEQIKGMEAGYCIYEFYFPSITTGELKTIDPKFLPSGGGGIPIIDISDIVSLGGEYQGGGELRFDLTENQVERIGSTLECKCFLFEVYDMQCGIMCTPYLINGVVCGYQGQLAIEGQVMLSFIVGIDSEPCILVFSNPLTPAEE